MSPLLRSPTFVRLGIQIDTAPAGAWLVLLGAALWPAVWWMGLRMVDGSDEPLGLLAVAALTALVWTSRKRLRPAPQLGWLTASLVAAVAATALLTHVPPLVSSMLGLLALGAGLVAFLPASVASTPVFGLSLLSLPLLASLQFYAGYPLRVVCAEVSRWLLAIGFDVTRTGATLVVDGRMVIVDAPCSGVQMLWFGYFTACVVALYCRRKDAVFLSRLPAVSLLVLAGNVVRNSILVAFEGAGVHHAGWAHNGIGLLVLAVCCGAIAWVMFEPRGARHV